MTGSRHLCFVAPSLWPVLSGESHIPIVGGAEVQQSFLVREFVRRGYRVSAICMDFGQADPEVVDGVTVYRMHAPDAGLPGVRFLYPRLTSLWSAMRRADADIYYQRTCSALTGLVAAFSRRRGRVSIYASSSDLDFHAAVPKIRLGRDRALFWWGVRQVSAIAVQSEQQRRDVLMHYGREGTIVPSCYRCTGRSSRPGGVVLWAGTIRAIKRPQLFLELARRCPRIRFRLVGGAAPNEGRLFDRITAEAATLSNIEMTGFVPFRAVERQFDDASLLVNTSEAEGFPNTFLHAWSRGIPTVSFCDVGLRWNAHIVGTVVGSVDEMVRRIESLMNNEDDWHHIGSTCREYFTGHHSVERAVDIYETLFDRLKGANRTRFSFTNSAASP